MLLPIAKARGFRKTKFLDENNPDKLIESILLKHVIFNVVWEMDDTNIVLYLDSEGSFVAFEKA